MNALELRTIPVIATRLPADIDQASGTSPLHRCEMNQISAHDSYLLYFHFHFLSDFHIITPTFHFVASIRHHFSASHSSNMDYVTNITELLLSKVNIYVTGACGPKREEPIQCFRPVHQSYQRPVTPLDHPIAVNLNQNLPGGSLRTLTNTSEGDQPSRPALVYDRDVICTWRLPTTMAAYEIYF